MEKKIVLLQYIVMYVFLTKKNKTGKKIFKIAKKT